MKLFKIEEDEKFLTRKQRKKVFLATSIMIIVLYLIAFTTSMLGGTYFLLDYHNARSDKIEEFLTKINVIDAVWWGFSTIEYTLILSFIINTKPKWYYILPFYAIPVAIYYLVGLPMWIQIVIPFLFYLAVPLIENKGFKWQPLVRLLIGVAISFALQGLIAGIKTGLVRDFNRELTFSESIAFQIEYDIALLTILRTVKLFLDKEKGTQVCENLGGFSQKSKKKLQTSKVLTSKQVRKLRLLYLRITLLQLGAFLLVMLLPFLIGKVYEFLTMYFCFCVVRYILGFKYSLHFKKEWLCILVGVIVFGFLSLVVPNFAINLVLGVVFGVGLAITLHISYKYKSMTLFFKKVGKDRFAELYVIFDGNFELEYVKKMAHHYGLSDEETAILLSYVGGDKLSYIAYNFNYSTIYINKILDRIIDQLKSVY